MRVHHVLVRHAGRHLAHPVHVVGEGDQPARPVDHLGQRVADHQGARHLLEGAEMRQARRPVAGLEDDRLRRPARPDSASAACALPHRARPCETFAASRSPGGTGAGMIAPLRRFAPATQATPWRRRGGSIRRAPFALWAARGELDLQEVIMRARLLLPLVFLLLPPPLSPRAGPSGWPLQFRFHAEHDPAARRRAGRPPPRQQRPRRAQFPAPEFFSAASGVSGPVKRRQGRGARPSERRRARHARARPLSACAAPTRCTPPSG